MKSVFNIVFIYFCVLDLISLKDSSGLKIDLVGLGQVAVRHVLIYKNC